MMETPSSPSSDWISGQTFRYREGDFIARGTFSRTFKGVFVHPDGNRDELPTAVKRVDFLGRKECVEFDPEVWALTTLSHPSLVKLYAAEDDWHNQIRNLVFEYCVASLEDYGESRYLGPMPDDKDGVYWMACGLDYLHSKRVAHWDINPSNILVSHHDNGGVRLKIGGFGSAKPLHDGSHVLDWVPRSKRFQEYLAPELLLLLKDRTQTRTSEICLEVASAVDVFAAGCTIFYYLTKGAHPFGRSPMVVDNILAKNAVSIGALPPSHWALDTVTKMIKHSPRDRLDSSSILQMTIKECNPHISNDIESRERTDGAAFINMLSTASTRQEYRQRKVVGKGSFGVFLRGWDSEPDVAMSRRHRIDYKDTSSEINVLQSLNHANVIKLFRVVDKSIFRYLLLELGAANLRDVCEGRYENDSEIGRSEGEIPSEAQVLIQMASGLDYIHSKGLLHGRICPESVLVSESKPVRVKWTGPKLSVMTDPEWMSPEVLEQKCRENVPPAVCGCHQRGKTEENRENSPAVCATEDAPRAGTSEDPWESRRQAPAAKKMRLECKCADGGDVVPYRQARLLKRNQEEAIRSEIFSIGCLFFYFATKGFHPFHESGRSILNIIQGLAPNMKKLGADHFAHSIIAQMIRREPEERNSLSDVLRRLRPLQSDTWTLATCFKSEKVYPISTGRWGTEVFKMFFHGEMIAVKRIKRETYDKIDDIPEKHIFMNKRTYPNLIQIYHFDKDSQHRYLGMELFAASLDQCFLPDDDPLKYLGPLPSDQQVLYQLANGLNFIHSFGTGHAHGWISPSKVLITHHLQPSIKISHFGLIGDRNLFHSSFNRNHNIRCWAPELIQGFIGGLGEPKFTWNRDVFALGCVMFYYLSGGRYPSSWTQESAADQVADFLAPSRISQDLHIAGLIRLMTQADPQQRPRASQVLHWSKLLLPMDIPMSRVRDVEFSKKRWTRDASFTYLGRTKGAQVVVRVLYRPAGWKEVSVQRERDALLKLDHSNIVKLINFAENERYVVIAFEKCLMNLSEYYGKLRHLYERLIPMPSDREILLQLATGLQYIHSKGIVHCDIKRENVLISHRQGSGEVVLKWTAFSLSKAGEDDGEPKPWSYYSDPNSDYDPRRSEMLPATFSSDVFLLGCVFFTVLLPDVYPFGYYAHSIRTPITILTERREALPLRIVDLVVKMIERTPDSRPVLSEIISVLNSTAF